MTRLGLVVALAATTMGCVEAADDSTDDGLPAAELDPLFVETDAPVTPGTIRGLWGAQLTYDDGSLDVRMKFTADSVTIANRCSYEDKLTVTVGVTAAATVTESAVTVLEAKEAAFADESHRCNVATAAKRIPFTIIDGRLSLDGAADELRKIRD